MTDERSQPEQVLGVYRLLQQLGEGGMGAVFLAEQTAPVRRRVALKVIKLGLDSREVLARFELERQSLAIMNHECIARVFDAGIAPDGRPYFAMEYIAGVPIVDYCDRRRLSIGERLRLFLQVCAAVQHAHQKGVIHRDIKPSNVLVTEIDGRPVPKIIDFGLARATNQRLTEQSIFTEQGRLLGTPEYMSPEQAEMGALDIDTRTDVYSLGVLLYQLLTGVLPFDSAELRRAGYLEIQRRIREDEPQKPSTRFQELREQAAELAQLRGTATVHLLRELRGELDWVTMRAMEKDRARRYGTAAEFAADIERHLRGEPVFAGPPSAAYRLRKLLRRHRVFVGSSLAVFVALAGALAASLHFLDEARTSAVAFRHERDQKDAALRTIEAEQAARATAEAATAAASRIADGQRLLTIANGLCEQDPTQAMLVALEGAGAAPGPDADRALFRALRGLREEHVLYGHEGELTALQLSRDGRRLASAAADQTVRVWDVDAGRCLHVIAVADPVRALRFCADDNRLLVGTAAGVVLYAIDPAEPPRRLAVLDSKEVPAVSRSGADLICWTSRAVRIVSANDGSLRLECKQTADVTGGDWWDDEDFVVFTSSGGSVCRRADGSVRGKVDGMPLDTQFDQSAASAYLTTTGERVLAWDCKTLAKVHEFRGRFARARGSHAVSWLGRTATIWDLVGRKQATVGASDVILDSHILDEQGSVLLIATAEAIRLVDWSTGRELMQTDRFVPWMSSLLTAGGRRLGTSLVERAVAVASLHASPLERASVSQWTFHWVDRRLAAGMAARAIAAIAMIGRPAKGKFRAIGAELDGTEHEVPPVASEPQEGAADDADSLFAELWGGAHAEAVDASIREALGWGIVGRRFLNGAMTSDRCVAALRVTGSEMQLVAPTKTTALPFLASATALPGEPGGVCGVDGSDIVSLDANGAQRWRRRLQRGGDSVCASSSCILVTRTVHRARGSSCEVFAARDGSHLGFIDDVNDGEVVVCLANHGQSFAHNRGHDVLVRAAAGGEPSAVLHGHGADVTSIDWSPDDARIVTAGADGEARLWDVATGACVGVLRGSAAPLTQVCFDASGSRVLTVGDDGCVRIWAVPSGQLLRTLGERAGEVLSAAFTNDGEHVVVATTRESLERWPIDLVAAALAHKPRELTPNERDRWLIGTPEDREAHRQQWAVFLRAAAQAGR